MIYNSAILNRKIDIIEKQTINNDGIDTLVDKKICSCWASIQPLRGRAYYEVREKATEEQAKIIIRYRKNLNTSMFIKYKEQIYNINSIVDPFSDHECLELYCTLKVR